MSKWTDHGAHRRMGGDELMEAPAHLLTLGQRVVRWRWLEGLRAGSNKPLPQRAACKRLGISRTVLVDVELDREYPQAGRILKAFHRETGIHPGEWARRWAAA